VATIQNTLRTNILSNPVTQFTKTFPDATEEQIIALTRLHQQYVMLKKQHKNIQNRRKKISRQFGEAKQNDQPVDNLIQAMQEHSTEINSQKIKLNNTADNILSYFESGNVSESFAERIPDLPPGRTHTDQEAGQVSIEQLSDDKNNDWNHYIKSNPAASIYHRAEWKGLIKNVFGHEGYYFYAHHHGEITGVLPLIRLKSRLFGDFIVSMPYFNYGGALANSLPIEQKLIRAANSFAKNLGVEHIEYRDDIARENLPARTEKVNMILSLPDSKHELWRTFTSKLRSQIRRAQREKPLVKFDSEACLDDFYAVFARNMRDLGTPVYGKSFFKKILQCFTEHSKIIVVYMGNKPVAAAFLLGNNQTLEIPWASTIKDVNHLSMNMLLYWETLKFAIKNQYRYFDFGRSSKDSGTFRFKQQWGAKPKQSHWHYWLSENSELPRLNPDNPKYALAINSWKRLPIKVTKWLGPLIVKNLP